MSRALVCSYYAPQVDRDTGSRRVMELIESLLGERWDVTFVAVHPDGGRYERALRQRGVAVHDGSGTLDDLVRSQRFDVALLAYWPVAERYLPAIRRESPQTRVIVDSIDLHFLRYARQMLGSGNRTLDVEFGNEMIGELNTYAAADAALTVSDKEARLIDDLTGEPGLARTVPLGEAMASEAAPSDARRGSVFVGNFQHAPNVEAVEFLCREVLPRLDPACLAKHPVYIVGSGITDHVRRCADGVAGVRMVGWVPQLAPYLRCARAALVPLRHGAGVKGKLIEAMAAGTPVVSTSIGVEGLDVRDGEHVLVADSADAFADALQRLLTDDALSARLAASARALVEARYSQTTSRRRFLDVITAVLGKAPKSAQVPDGGAAQYAARLAFQDKHRIKREAAPASTEPVTLPPPPSLVPTPPGSRVRRAVGPRVLVVGVCLTDQLNTADRIVAVLNESRWCRVSQRWAALGAEPSGHSVPAVTVLIVRDRVPKFAIVNQILQGVDLGKYEYVLMTDDDIVLPDGFLDVFIEQQQSLDFAIAQPARTGNSYVDHPIVEQHLGVIARRTRFVEIGPVVSFHRSVFPLVFPFDLTSPMGWGYENVWSYQLAKRGLRMGIIDAAPVDHSIRPPVANYSWSSGDAGREALLGRREHLTIDECMRVLEAFPADP